MRLDGMQAQAAGAGFPTGKSRRGAMRGIDMAKPYPFELLEEPRRLARFQGWSEEVYRDFLACQRGEMMEEAFRGKYARTVAILILDMTGFTAAAIGMGSLFSFLRIFDVQKVCAPVFAKHGALHARAFADDLTATFTDPHAALNAAFEIHHRVRLFNASDRGGERCAQTCIGLGYGEVFQIGPDRAMGNEMNQTSKLGEDTAGGFETLTTLAFYEAVKERADCRFESRTHEELPFPYFSVTPLE